MPENEKLIMENLLENEWKWLEKDESSTKKVFLKNDLKYFVKLL